MANVTSFRGGSNDVLDLFTPLKEFYIGGDMIHKLYPINCSTIKVNVDFNRFLRNKQFLGGHIHYWINSP